MEYYVGYIESNSNKSNKFILFNEEFMSARIVSALELKQLYDSENLLPLRSESIEVYKLSEEINKLGNIAKQGVPIETLEAIRSRDEEVVFWNCSLSVGSTRGLGVINRVLALTSRVSLGYVHLIVFRSSECGVSASFTLNIFSNDDIECNYSCYNPYTTDYLIVSENSVKVLQNTNSSCTVFSDLIKEPSSFSEYSLSGTLVSYGLILFSDMDSTLDSVILPETIQYAYISYNTTINKLVLNESIEELIIQEDCKLRELYIPKNIKLGLLEVLNRINSAINGKAPSIAYKKAKSEEDRINVIIRELHTDSGITVTVY